MILNFLNLLRFVWWPNIWSTLENVLCALKKNYILLLWDGMFCVCLLGILDLSYSLSDATAYSFAHGCHTWVNASRSMPSMCTCHLSWLGRWVFPASGTHYCRGEPFLESVHDCRTPWTQVLIGQKPLLDPSTETSPTAPPHPTQPPCFLFPTTQWGLWCTLLQTYSEMTVFLLSS